MTSTHLEPYERFLWNILCRRDQLRGIYPVNKAKRMAILAYWLYYRGVTVQQILLAKMSDSADASVVRSTLAKYSTSDVRCSIIPEKHLADTVNGLADVTAADAKKPYYTFQIQYGKKRIRVYELSDHGLSESIYELLDLPASFLSGVTRNDLSQMPFASHPLNCTSLQIPQMSCSVLHMTHRQHQRMSRGTSVFYGMQQT